MKFEHFCTKCAKVFILAGNVRSFYFSYECECGQANNLSITIDNKMYQGRGGNQSSVVKVT